jgi:hypothetical protein
LLDGWNKGSCTEFAAPSAEFTQDQCFSISFFEGNGHEHGADAKRKELLAGHEIKKLVSLKQRRRV